MKPGSKYYPLYQHLGQRQQATVTLTLAEIESLIGSKLPISAKTQRGWWSNRNTGALQANAWIEAGYQVNSLDLDQQIITFGPFEAEYNITYADGEIAWDKAAIRALRKHMKLTQAQFADTLGVRRQTISEWENGAYLPDRSTVKHLALVAQTQAFEPQADGDAEAANE